MDSKANASSAWGRIKRNLGILLGERAVFAVVNFIAAAIAVRATSLEVFGQVAVLLAFSRLVGDIGKFNSWQAVLTYGAPLKAEGDARGLGRLIGLTLMLDSAAIAASLAAAWIVVWGFGEAMGWSAEMIAYAPWFCVIIAFIMHMTPTGVLRLYDWITPIAANHAITATVRLIGVGAIWIWGGGFFELALVWTLAAVIAGLVLWGFAWAVIRREAVKPRIRAAGREGALDFGGFWNFAGATNLISTLNLILPNVATLIVNGALGGGAAGLFAIVRQLTEAMSRPGDMLGPLFFSEFADLEAKNDRRAMRRLVKRAMIWSGVILIAAIAVLAIAGGWILRLGFGPEAEAGHTLLILVGVSSAILVWGFTLEPVLLTLKRAAQTLWSVIAAWVVFGAILWATLTPYGLIGVGAAMIGHRATQFLIRFAIVARLLSKDRT
ncbi:MAG: hypothetical protein AAF401_13265 [Pseudomonadota bacterium]